MKHPTMGRLKEKICLFTGNTRQREEKRRGHMGRFPQGMLHPCFQGRVSSQPSCFPWESLWLMAATPSCAFVKNSFTKHWVYARGHLGSHEISQRSRSSPSWSHTLTGSLSLLSECWLFCWTSPQKSSYFSLSCLIQRSPTFRICLMIWSGADVTVTEIKCARNIMCLNHAETIPPPPPTSVEKLSSTKTVPGARKVGDCWFNSFES